MRLTPRVAGFRSEYPAGFKLECMAGFVGTRNEAIELSGYSEKSWVFVIKLAHPTRSERVTFA